jgi:hypothetical protein
MNATVIIVCVLGGLLALGLFSSFVTGLGKTFKSQPSSSSLKSSQIKEKQRQTSEDAREKQQQLMDSIKQKISDNKKF